MHPQQAVVGGGGGDNGFRFSETAVDRFIARQKTRDGARADRYVPPHRDIAPAEFSWNHAEPVVGPRVFHQKQTLRQLLTKAAVELEDARRCESTACQTARIDPRLHRDVSFRLKLPITLAFVTTVVVLQSTLDVHWMRVVKNDYSRNEGKRD